MNIPADHHGAPGDEEFLKAAPAMRDFRVLEEIERDPSVSQRELASRLGVAVGVANACVRTLVRRGLVKVQGDNNRSISYHLTKAGLLHKGRLAMEWSRNTIAFYRDARHRIAERMAEVAATGATTIVLYGDNEVAEIASIVASGAGVRILGVVSAGSRRVPDIAGLPVGDLDRLGEWQPDAIVACTAVPAKVRGRLEAIAPVHEIGEGFE